LRKNLSIIPQTPIMFKGTIRYNIDPLDQYNDDLIWNALKEVQLYSHVKGLNSGLDTKISGESGVFSVG